jgi:hypothetical protein
LHSEGQRDVSRRDMSGADTEGDGQAEIAYDAQDYIF